VISVLRADFAVVPNLQAAEYFVNVPALTAYLMNSAGADSFAIKDNIAIRQIDLFLPDGMVSSQLSETSLWSDVGGVNTLIQRFSLWSGVPIVPNLFWTPPYTVAGTYSLNISGTFYVSMVNVSATLQGAALVGFVRYTIEHTLAIV